MAFTSLLNLLSSEFPRVHPVAREPVGQPRAGKLGDACGTAREVLAVEDQSLVLETRRAARHSEAATPSSSSRGRDEARRLVSARRRHVAAEASTKGSLAPLERAAPSRGR